MNEEKECINPPEDDGSLAWLHIPSDASRKSFNCPETTQQKLVNTTFWVIDYYDEIKTKYGMRTLVKIKNDPKLPLAVFRQLLPNTIRPLDKRE